MAEGVRDDITKLIEGDHKSPFYKLVPNGAIFINLCFKKGEQMAYPYTYLTKLSFETDSIKLNFSEDRIVIKGLCLKELYQKLLLQEVSEISEANSQFESQDQTLFIESISIYPQEL